MVLGGECSQGKALGVIIPETNISLGSGPMGYYYSQITGGRKRGSSQEDMAVSGATCQVCFHPT